MLLLHFPSMNEKKSYIMKMRSVHRVESIVEVHYEEKDEQLNLSTHQEQASSSLLSCVNREGTAMMTMIML